MNDQQLTERLTRAADGLPPPAQTALVTVQRRVGARRRYRYLRRGAAATAIVAVAVASVPSLTQAGRSPEIAPLTQQPDGAPPPEAAPRGTDARTDTTAPSGTVEQRAPQPAQLNTAVEFEVYAIVAPDGWEHVHTGVRTVAPEAWTSVDTRWTPSGSAGGGEADARLDLRQTDVSTLGGGPMPVTADANSIELRPGLTAYLATERLPSGIEHLLEWQRGDTYLELTGQGLTVQELTDAAATAEPTPSGQSNADPPRHEGPP